MPVKYIERKYEVGQKYLVDEPLAKHFGTSRFQKSRLITFQVVLMLMFTTRLKETNTKNLVFKFIQFLNKG